MDAETVHTDSKRILYVLKTGNDLTFHFSPGEFLSVVLRDLPEELQIEELENKKLPFYLVDPGSELLYPVVRFGKKFI
jgi:hypothetical protein